jgi:hypothetical protein
MSVTTESTDFSTSNDVVYIGDSQLADDNDGPPFVIHGVALGAGDVTTGESGIEKFWPADELQDAAESLEGQALVEDHDNSARGVVGEVVKAGYKDGVGVIYEAELDDETLAEKIENGRLDVSVRGFHKSVDELDETDDGAKKVEDIVFDNLSIVRSGASSSNTVRMGEHDELSQAQLSTYTAELAEDIEPADYVKWDDGHGIVFQVGDGEATVEVMEESDGMWRATGDEETVPMSDLSEWDVDEEEDIGAPKDDDSDKDDMDEEEAATRPGDFVFDSEQRAADFIEDRNGLTGIHTHVMDDTRKYMPGKDMEEFMKWFKSLQEMQNQEMPGVDDTLIEVGAVFSSDINDSLFTVSEVAGDRVRITHDNESNDHGWWERMEDIRRKVDDGVWTRVDEVENEGAQFSRGDWVRWDTRNSTELGKVTGTYHEGDDLPDFRGSRGFSPEEGEHLYALRMYKQRDGTWHPIEGKPIGHYEDSIRSAEKPSDVSDEPVELGRSNHEQYDVEKHDWVQWYPSETTEEHGFVVDVEDNEDNDGSTVTIEVWTQNSDGEWETDGEEITKSMEAVEPWGNFPRKQEEFADAIDGEDPRRAVKPSEEENESEELVSDQVEQSLKDKVEKHNEEYGDEEGKRVTYRMLKNVFNRGMGAYQDSHREGMTAQQWSYARVNAFLYLVRNGNPENDQYTQDNDLLPEDHPKYNEDGDDEEENASLMEPPQFDEGEMVQWQVEPDLFGEIVHNPDDEPVIMVEIMDRADDGFETTHYTISAYPSDIVHMDESRMSDIDALAEMDELDRVYDEWEEAVNMTASELRDWSTNPCSREASVDPEAVIERNLRLLETNKSDWNEEDIVDAKRTISFVARMSDEENEPDDPMDGVHGCPSKWAISLLNWAHNPFDSMPDVPDDPDLESVDEVTLGDVNRPEGAEEYTDGHDKCNQPQRYPNHRCEKCSDELAEYEWHEPSWSGTTEMEWSTPDYSEFQDEYGFDGNFADLSDEDKSTVANHFLVARGEFPGETYSDLKLPVVEPNGDLSRNALLAVKGGRGASAVDGLSSEMEETIIEWVNETANDPDVFDESWGMDEEENMDVDGEDKYETARRMLENFLDIGGNSMDSSIKSFDGHSTMDRVSEVIQEYLRKNDDASIESPVSEFSDWLSDMSTNSMPGDHDEDEMNEVRVMTGDDLRQAYNGASVSVADTEIATTQTGDIIMDDEIEAELSKLDEPTAVEQDTLEELQSKAEKYDNMEEDIASLRERTEVLDEADRDTVEELAEMEDPVVLESAEYEQLSDETEEVARVYAEKISEGTPFDSEELSAKYDIGELREKFEEMGHSTEELASAEETDPAPKSTDADEEELENAAQDEESDEAELAEDVAQAQKEMAERIGIDFDTGGD